MTLNQNQFRQQPIRGQLDLALGSQNVVQAQVYASESTALIPGIPVTLKSGQAVGGLPIVTAATVDTDPIFGYVSYAQRDASFAANAAVTICLVGTVMWMVANAAIERGAALMAVISTTAPKVAAKTANVKKSIIGWAFDNSSADGDLIRVWITTPNQFQLQSFTDLADAPATITSSYYIKVNASGTALVNAVS